MDRDGVQTIVEIFAETSLAYCLVHVDVGCGNDAHIGFHYLLTTHTYVFACFEHTQQACLCCHWQLADLIEEDSAFVCRTEIAFALADCTRERSLLMSKEFAVYSAFRYRAAVDGEVFLVFAWRIVVYQSRYYLFSHTALAHNEHTEVCRRHLLSDVESTVQRIAVAHDVVPLF